MHEAKAVNIDVIKYKHKKFATPLDLHGKETLIYQLKQLQIPILNWRQVKYMHPPHFQLKMLSIPVFQSKKEEYFHF